MFPARHGTDISFSFLSFHFIHASFFLLKLSDQTLKCRKHSAVSLPFFLFLGRNKLQRAVCGVTGHSVFWSKKVKNKSERENTFLQFLSPLLPPFGLSNFSSHQLFLLERKRKKGRKRKSYCRSEWKVREKRPKRDWIWRRRFQSLFNEFSFFPTPSSLLHPLSLHSSSFLLFSLTLNSHTPNFFSSPSFLSSILFFC